MNDPPASASVPLSGNWAFSVSLSGSANTLVSVPPFLAGSLMVSGTQLSADFLPMLTPSSNCSLSGAPDVALTGTVTKGQVSLMSAAWYGAVITVTGTVSADGQTINGSWAARGGCIDGQSGSLVANYVPPFTGTWTGSTSNLPAGLTGTSTSSSLTGATVTLQMQQSASPTKYSFPLSGSVTIAGINCGFSRGTVIQSDLSAGQPPSFVVGNNWVVEAQMDDGKSRVAIAGAPTPTTSTQWLAVVTVVGGSCNQATAQATLARQQQ